MKAEMEMPWQRSRRKIPNGFRAETAFEVDPEEQVEFCLGEWARGTFWPEGATRAKAQRHKNAGHTWVQ